MADVSLKHVKKIYPGNVVAVEDFSLFIPHGSFLVFVGPSGCGKSTTLRMIAGLEEISEGELYIGGNLVNEVSARDRNISMVFQNYALFPHLSVYDNIAFGLKLRKTPKEELDSLVQEAAASLGIGDLLNRKPKTLSGGQRQRVALGRAMVRKPDVFLLDEPLSNLDASLRHAMREELTTLHKKLDTTFIYVTHDQVEAMSMGDMIVVMNKGKIMQVDSPQNLYHTPQNVFVASFMGTPAMNFLKAGLEKGDNGYFLCVGNVKIPLPVEQFPANKLDAYLGQVLTLGIRPEDLNFADAHQGHTLPCEVTLIEDLGDKSYVSVHFGQEVIRVKTLSNPPFTVGEQQQLAINLTRLHLFDQEEARICASSQ